jgi:hypothetical protein
MSYTRAYQLPTVPLEERSTLLNITPSSNWIQETFNSSNRVEDEEFGRVFVIEKATRQSLYQKLIAMQVRAKLFNLASTVSDVEPNAEQLKKLTQQAGGDLTRLAMLIEDWKKRTVEEYADLEVSEVFVDISDERILLDANLILQNSSATAKFTISSLDLPTKGDMPVTAILYSPAIGDKMPAEGGIKVEPTGITGEEIPFSWTDKSGFESTIMILPNVIYEIQPVSIGLGYEITLLA